MFLAIKELWYNKTRYTLIISILVLLMFLVLFLSGLASGLSSATSSLIDGVAANAYLVSDDADNMITRSFLSEAQLHEIQGEVEEATPITIQRATMFQKNDSQKNDITYLVVDSNSFMMPEISEGNIGDEENWIVLNDSFKDSGIKIGDTIVDSTSDVKLLVTGFSEKQMYAHSPIGVINQKTFHKIKGLNQSSESNIYNAVALKEKSIKDMDGMKLLSKQKVIENIPGHSQEQSTIQMILVVLLGISAFILGTFFYVLTIQKTSQFGILKALGTSMKSLALTIFLQVFLLASIAMVIGNALTFLMARFLPRSMPFLLNGMSALLISIAFIVISILCSLLSLRKVAKIDPLIAIGGNEHE